MNPKTSDKIAKGEFDHSERVNEQFFCRLYWIGVFGFKKFSALKILRQRLINAKLLEKRFCKLVLNMRTL